MTDLVALGFKLFGLRGELSRGHDLAKPALEDLERVLPELLAIGQRVQQELFPHQIKNATCASFDYFWVQRSLNQLGDKLKVDGEPGPATTAAVKAYQVKHLIVPDDGIPGRDTCVSIFCELKK